MPAGSERETGTISSLPWRRHVVTRIPRPHDLAVIAIVMLGALAPAPPVRAARLLQPRWDNVTSLTQPLQGPDPRKHHVMVMDPVGNQVIMWSGENEFEELFDSNRVWILNLCTMQWSPQTTYPVVAYKRPAPRHGHSAVILPEQRKAIVMMGSTVASHYDREVAEATDSDVWELDLTNFTWSRQTVGGEQLPCPRWHSTAVSFGSTQNNAQIYVYGGRTPSPAPPPAPPFAINDTWLLQQNSSGWQWVFKNGTCVESPNSSGDRPFRRYKHSLVVARENATAPDKLYLAGGIYFNDIPENIVERASVTGSVTWEGSFSDVTQTEFARIEHSAIVDPIGSRMIIFGGHLNPLDGTGNTQREQPVDKLSAMSIVPTCPAAPGYPGSSWGCWSSVSTVGTAPSARKGHAAVYDPVGDRMIVFGGQLGPNAEGSMTDQTWVLSFSRITDLGVDSYTSQTATLGWTSPAIPGSSVPPPCYDIRRSANPIVTDADFAVATVVQPSYLSQTTNSNGTRHVIATIAPISNASYYAVRPGNGTPGPISNNVCFKVNPYLPCMEEVRTELEGSPSATRISLSVPNPGDRRFECTMTVPGTEAAVLTVHDVAGRSVERHAVDAGTRTVRIGDAVPLRPGFYLVVLRQGANESRKSVIVR